MMCWCVSVSACALQQQEQSDLCKYSCHWSNNCIWHSSELCATKPMPKYCRSWTETSDVQNYYFSGNGKTQYVLFFFFFLLYAFIWQDSWISDRKGGREKGTHAANTGQGWNQTPDCCQRLAAAFLHMWQPFYQVSDRAPEMLQFLKKHWTLHHEVKIVSLNIVRYWRM